MQISRTHSKPVSAAAERIAELHNKAARRLKANRPAFIAFDPHTGDVVEEYRTPPPGRFPSGTVLTRAEFGRITPSHAQALLEGDGY